MAKSSRKRIRRLRAALRAARVPTFTVRSIREREVVDRATRYVLESYEPNIKEPFSIHNRRTELVSAVFALRPDLRERTRGR